MLQVPSLVQSHRPALVADAARNDLEWVVHALSGPRRQLAVTVSAEPMLSQDVAVLLPMLRAADTPDADSALAELSIDLLRWALRLSMQVAPDAGDPDQVTLADLELLAARLRQGHGARLGRAGAAPLAFAVLREFLCTRVSLTLATPPALLGRQQDQVAARGLAAADPAEGILLPWFGELGIFAQAGDGAQSLVRDFYGQHARPVSKEWEDALCARLRHARPDYPSAPAVTATDAAAGLSPFDASDKLAVDVVVEEWAAALVRELARRTIALFRASAAPQAGAQEALTLAFLCDALRQRRADGASAALEVAQHAGAFLQHGLRVPPATGDGADLALSELLGQDIALAELGAAPALQLRFRPLAEGLLEGSADLGPFDTGAAMSALGAAAAELLAHPIALSVETEAVVLQPRRLPCDTAIALTPHAGAGAALRYLPFPPWIARRLAELAAQPAPSLVLALLIDDSQTPVEAPRWISKVDLRLRRVEAATAGAPGGGHVVYAIAGVDEPGRAVLGALTDRSGEAVIRSMRLACGTPAASALRYFGGEQAFLFASNQSCEAALPAAPLAKAAADSDQPAFAYLKDHDAVAHILWTASVVNGAGFHLAFTDADPLAGMFDSAQELTVSALFECAIGARPGFAQAFMDGVVVDKEALGDDKAALLIVPDAAEWEPVSNVPAGQVALRILRPNALAAGDDTPAGSVGDARTLAARYRLVDYAILAGARFEGAARESMLPVDVELSDREAAAAGDAPARWRHRLVVPLADYAKASNRAHGGAPNPYALVGADVSASLKVGLRDGAGHLLPDAMLRIEAWKDPAVQYRDPMPPMADLAGVTSGWALARVGESAELTISLRWDASTLFPEAVEEGASESARKQALRMEYARLRWMAVSPGFAVSAAFSLGETSVATLDLTKDYVRWIEQIAAALDGAAPAAQLCTGTMKLDALPAPASARPLELTVQIVLTRDGALCDSAAGPDVQSVSWPVVHESSAAGGELDWRAIAHALDAAFGDCLVLLRRVGPAPRQGALWVLPGTSLPPAPATLAAREATFLAPAPLAKTFMSGALEVPLETGASTPAQFSGMDLDVLGASAANLLERFLGPRAGQTLCRSPGSHYAQLAAAKRIMADAVARRLTPVLPTTMPRAQLAGAVGEFRNSAGADLRTAFAPAVATTVHLADTAIDDVFLCGALLIDRASARYTTSTARIPLGPNGVEGAFAFVVHWADPDSKPPAVLTGPLVFAPRYVEVRQAHDGRNDEAPPDSYEIIWADPDADHRLTFAPPAGAAAWSVPLPLRLVPPAPIVLGHRGVTSDGAMQAQTLAEFVQLVRAWEYQVDVAIPREDHDTASLRIAFSDQAAMRLASGTPLFGALAAYAYHAPALAEQVSMLEAGTALTQAQAAFACQLLRRVADALWAAAPGPAARAAAPDDALRVALRSTSTESEWQLAWSAEGTGDKTVKARLLPFAAADGEALDPPTSADGAGIARYQLSDDVARACVGEGGLSARRVSVASLDMFRQAGARTRVQARRNQDVGGVAVAAEFVFSTVEASSVDTLIPQVRNDDSFDITKGVTQPAPIATWLRALVDTLFDNDDGIRAAYSVGALATLHCPLGQDAAAHVAYPLALIAGVKAAEEGWVESWAANLEAAIAALGPVALDHANLVLALKIYENTNLAEPAMTLSGLTLPMSKVLPGAASMLAADGAKRGAVL